MRQKVSFDTEEKGSTGTPGQDLVLAGYMGLAGSAMLADMEKERLRKRLPEELLRDTTERYRKLKNAVAKLEEELVKDQSAGKWLVYESGVESAGCGRLAWFPAGEGGVLNALWYMAHQWETGFALQLKELPVRQETIEICEILELNPYYLWSESCLLMAADHGDRLCAALKRQGIPAAVIGVLTDSNDRVLLHDDTVSYLNRPKEDERDRFLRERTEAAAGPAGVSAAAGNGTK